MNKITSLYLDLTRFLAAITVIISHAHYDRLHGDWLPAFGLSGSDAVIIFFVLSGYVIAHVSLKREKTLADYTISRFARLYSVVVPAIIVTVIADQIGISIQPELYSGPWFEDSYPAIRVFGSLLYLNELWFISIRTFSNGPFWSINYEFWYYVVFAIAFYLKGNLRLFLLVITCLLIGPKILFMLPIWGIGVLAYYISERKIFSINFGYLMFISSLITLCLYCFLDTRQYYMDFTKELINEDALREYLRWGRNFIANYLVALIVFINFIGVATISKGNITIPDKAGKIIRHLSSYTFSLYLMHYPLLHLFAAITENGVLVFLYTMTTIFIIGTYTESKKHLLKKLMQQVFNKFESKRPCLIEP